MWGKAPTEEESGAPVGTGDVFLAPCPIPPVGKERKWAETSPLPRLGSLGEGRTPLAPPRFDLSSIQA